MPVERLVSGKYFFPMVIPCFGCANYKSILTEDIALSSECMGDTSVEWECRGCVYLDEGHNVLPRLDEERDDFLGTDFDEDNVF